MKNINLLFLLAALFFFTGNNSLFASKISQITTNISLRTDSLLSIVTISDLPNRPMHPFQSLADFRYCSFYTILSALPPGIYVLEIETENGLTFFVLVSTQ